MKTHVKIAKWILVFGGLLLAYEGLTDTNLIESIFGSLEPVIDIVVFGGAAVLLGYHLMMMKSKK